MIVICEEANEISYIPVVFIFRSVFKEGTYEDVRKESNVPFVYLVFSL